MFVGSFLRSRCIACILGRSSARKGARCIHGKLTVQRETGFDGRGTVHGGVGSASGPGINRRSRAAKGYCMALFLQAASSKVLPSDTYREMYRGVRASVPLNGLVFGDAEGKRVTQEISNCGQGKGRTWNSIRIDVETIETTAIDGPDLLVRPLLLVVALVIARGMQVHTTRICLMA
jgi:hypothetical protein